jgi:ribonuclease VapC
MVIDTSAVLAILLNEPERRSFNERIEDDPTRLMSAASYFEAAIIIDNRVGRERGRDLKLFVIEAEIEIVPVSLEHAEIAREAYRQFGRGNHPAGLNFGDCFAYALAKAADEPLLFKGDDFGKTDLASAA